MNSRKPPSPLPRETASPVPAALEWRVHLARRQPARAIAAAACILLAGLGALLLFQSLLSALLSAGLLFAATSEFLLPMTYRLTAEAAEARGPLIWRQIRWGDVKRVYAGPGEIKLSPLAHGGPREAFRGVLLRCDGNQATVVALTEEFRRAAARS